MNNIFESFPISVDEYHQLHEKFSQLTYYASWQLARKNTRNNHQNDIDDFQQDLLISVMRAGAYFKRQVYIEKCLTIAKEYAKDPFMVVMLAELEVLWKNRTRHGANRQKYGAFQEKLLDKILKRIVPKNRRPDKAAHLKIDAKFSTYCKQIIWNAQRSMGKKITREKPLRSGQVSLSDFDFLATV